MSEATHNTDIPTATLRLAETKLLVDDYLKDYFLVQTPQARAVSKRYERLWKAAEQLTLAGGKRFRPYIVLLAYRAFGGDMTTGQILPAAVACELLHQAMLIHDDIIDRDEVRYGMANITGQYRQEYSHLPETEQRHFANSAAILIGDVLIAEAHRLLATSSDDIVLLRKAQLAFSIAIMHVVGGELIDTESSIRHNDDVHAVTVARYKTASYSFIGPLSVGAHLAGADEHNVEVLKDYADSLGIAFQLKDDLLGTFGDSLATGKSSDTDLREGKRTYLIEQLDEAADDATRSEFYSLFGRQDLTDQQADRLRQILAETGALNRTQAAVDEYAHKAKVSLKGLTIDAEYLRELENLISLCVDRDK